MFETISDIKRLNYSDPVYYTERFTKNDYVRANDLARHIHVFNDSIKVDYSVFLGLHGRIHKLRENKQVRFFDNVIRSGPFEETQTVYTFNKNLELCEFSIDDNGSKVEVFFIDSLKHPKMTREIKSLHAVRSHQREISYNDHLEYEQIEQIFHDQTKRNEKIEQQKTTKYVFKAGELIQKIHIKNNSDEQSKTFINYINGFQITDSKTYSQKDKTELLYETRFHYDDHHVLTKIVYTRHKATKRFAGNWIQEVNFEYDSKGLLIKLTDNLFSKTWVFDSNENPIVIKEYDRDGFIRWESNYKYVYDNDRNWIKKETVRFRFDGNKKIKLDEVQQSREIEYASTSPISERAV